MKFMTEKNPFHKIAVVFLLSLTSFASSSFAQAVGPDPAMSMYRSNQEAGLRFVASGLPTTPYFNSSPAIPVLNARPMANHREPYFLWQKGRANSWGIPSRFGAIPLSSPDNSEGTR